MSIKSLILFDISAFYIYVLSILKSSKKGFRIEMSLFHGMCKMYF